MSDTTVISTVTGASASVPWLLLALCSFGVAAARYGIGWLAAWADRRWPAGTRYEQEPEQ